MDRVEVSGSILLVDGRCLSGPVKIGDYFTLVYTKPIRRVNGEFIVDARVDCRPIMLRIDRIVIYRHDIDCIEDGLTARLSLTGSDQNEVVVGRLLGDH